MSSHSATELQSVPDKLSTETARIVGGRLVWLDIVRFLCALMILGIHWLRACFKLRLFGSASEPNLVIGYQGQNAGLRMLPHVFIAGTGHLLSVWLSNVIGVLGEFGWEGVSALIIVSGFSLTVSLKRKELTVSTWIAWIKKRAIRILIPFYIVSIPFLAIYLTLISVAAHVHGAFAASIDSKLHSVLQAPLLGVILSHTILLDPYNKQWQPDFFAPAWWFVPAILIAYVAYPFIRSAVGKLGQIPMLATSAVITIVAYRLADAHILVNESWYFIVLQELFNLTLGVVVGNIWLSAEARPTLEKLIIARSTFPIALLIFVAGNVANWSPGTRPFASMLYGPGLLLMITVIAKALEHTRVARVAVSIDAYNLYLVHQPFAFPVALAAKFLLHSYAIFIGWFLFVGIASIATFIVMIVERSIFGKSQYVAPTRKSPVGG